MIPVWLVLGTAWFALCGNLVFMYFNWRSRQVLKETLAIEKSMAALPSPPPLPVPEWEIPLYCFICGESINVGDDVVITSSPSVQHLSHGRPTAAISTLKRKEPLASTDKKGTS